MANITRGVNLFGLPNYLIAIGEQKFSNYYQFTKFAFNSLISTGTLKILSNNLNIAQPAAGIQMSIVSTSAQDSSTGTGIGKVLLQYWDSNWNFIQEVLTLNGLTAVNTVGTDIFRIEELYRISAGTGLTAQGTVTMSDVPVSGNIYAQIDINRGMFERCLHYVAPGRIGIMTAVVASARTSGGVNFIIVRDFDFSSIGGSSRIPVGVGQLEHASGGSAFVEIAPPLFIDNRNSTQGMAFGISVVATTVTNQDGSAAFNVYKFEP